MWYVEVDLYRIYFFNSYSLENFFWVLIYVLLWFAISWHISLFHRKSILIRTLHSTHIVRMNTKKRFRFSFYPCITFSRFHLYLRACICLSLSLMYAFISISVSTFSCYWYNICPEKREFYFSSMEQWNMSRNSESL